MCLARKPVTLPQKAFAKAPDQPNILAEVTRKPTRLAAKGKPKRRGASRKSLVVAPSGINPSSAGGGSNVYGNV